MDRSAIERAIPHRAPFLFVDRVLEKDAGRIVTEWDVPKDLFAFQGHYPGQPVLPGVLASEFCFQSAAILFAEPGAKGPAEGAVPVLTRIEDARFKKIVLPGETLRAELATTETLANVRWMNAHVTSGGKSVLRIRFAVALVAPESSGGGAA
ncbi:MAG: beta-hydroxyacyl-ACP dehydratase [Planctomycetes bacterium]|nr:beta-hydroxyacyl-ACP dehydratase [Planctomycetota bacterium]